VPTELDDLIRQRLGVHDFLAIPPAEVVEDRLRRLLSSGPKEGPQELRQLIVKSRAEEDDDGLARAALRRRRRRQLMVIVILELVLLLLLVTM